MESARRSRPRPCVRWRRRAARSTWERVDAGAGAVEKHRDPLPQATIESIKKHQLALKGPLGDAERRRLSLASTSRCASSSTCTRTSGRRRRSSGVPSRYADVDLVIVRENTEDLYAGVEHYVDPRRTAAESIAIITRFGSERVIKYAFEYARRHGPQEGDARPQGEHPEDVERPVPRLRQGDREELSRHRSSTT